MMLVLALIHTFPFIVYHISMGDMVNKWTTDPAYWTGTAALVAPAWLTFMSIGPLRSVSEEIRITQLSLMLSRNRYYEFFKVTHYVAIIVFVVFFFIHCEFRLSSWYVA